jgi:hypothetical protein
MSANRNDGIHNSVYKARKVDMVKLYLTSPTHRYSAARRTGNQGRKSGYGRRLNS